MTTLSETSVPAGSLAQDRGTPNLNSALVKILVFTEGTLLIHKDWPGLSREEMAARVKAAPPPKGPQDWDAQVPAGRAVGKLHAWQAQGAETAYLTSRRKPEEVEVIRQVLRRHHFPDGPLYFRREGERYSDVAERVRPDVLVEDDCESIGGEAEMTYPHIRPEFKSRITSITVPEFGGIDHLPDDLEALQRF